MLCEYLNVNYKFQTILLGLYIPDWFSVFLFGLGSVFFVLSEKFEKGQ